MAGANGVLCKRVDMLDCPACQELSRLQEIPRNGHTMETDGVEWQHPTTHQAPQHPPSRPRQQLPFSQMAPRARQGGNLPNTTSGMTKRRCTEH